MDPTQISSRQPLRFVVRSSDVLSDMRITVSEENSDRVLWYKERYLVGDEIVENLVENATSTVKWTIHRPTRGWYIRMCSPSFPPGAYIPLLPVPRDADYHSPAALSFSCRTQSLRPNACKRTPSMETDITLQDDVPSVTVHSYPPTPPPATAVRPPSPGEVRAKLNEIAPHHLAQTGAARTMLPLSTQVTQFYLAPLNSMDGAQMAQASFFSRMLAALKAHTSGSSNSFNLYPVEPIILSEMSPSATHALSSILPSHHTAPSLDVPSARGPFLTFHDRTPTMTVRSLTGMIEIDRTVERLLGVRTSFWIAVVLTYLEFLEERESYLAAVND